MSDEATVPVTAEVPVVSTTTEAIVTPTTVTTSWFESLPEDLRNEPSLQNFKDKDTSEVVKSYVNAQKEIGSRIRIPSSEASKEAREEFFKKLESVDGVVRLPDANDPASIEAFYSKLGRPSTPEGYSIEIDENIPLKNEQIESFKSLAHNLGLTQVQAEKLVAFESEINLQHIETAMRHKDETIGVLKEQWGKDFQGRMESAGECINHLAAKFPDAAQEILTTSIGSNPIVIQMAAELGRLYKENGLIQGTRSITYNLTPDEARGKLSDIQGNKDHAYHNVKHPEHNKAVEDVSKLFEAVYSKPDNS